MFALDVWREDTRTAPPWRLTCEETMKAKALESVKSVIRHPYAWPGGYPRMVIMSDGEALCHKCARAEFKLIARATVDGNRRSGWEAIGDDINWEDSDLHCAHCSEQIESAYGQD